MVVTMIRALGGSQDEQYEGDEGCETARNKGVGNPAKRRHPVREQQPRDERRKSGRDHILLLQAHVATDSCCVGRQLSTVDNPHLPKSLNTQDLRIPGSATCAAALLPSKPSSWRSVRQSLFVYIIPLVFRHSTGTAGSHCLMTSIMPSETGSIMV